MFQYIPPPPPADAGCCAEDEQEAFEAKQTWFL